MRSILTLGAAFISAHCMAQSGNVNVNDLAAVAELVKANGCYSCHSAAEKIVGPAFKDIATKYKDDKGAVATLAQSIQYGSKGKWGRIPMPPHSTLSSGDLKAMAGWVLATPQP